MGNSNSNDFDTTQPEEVCISSNEYQKLLFDIRRFNNIKQIASDLPQCEFYQCPHRNDLMLKETGIPQTSEKTKSFEMAYDIRSPYDKYWLKIYNNNANNKNYSL